MREVELKEWHDRPPAFCARHRTTGPFGLLVLHTVYGCILARRLWHERVGGRATADRLQDRIANPFYVKRHRENPSRISSNTKLIENSVGLDSIVPTLPSEPGLHDRRSLRPSICPAPSHFVSLQLVWHVDFLKLARRRRPFSNIRRRRRP